MSSSSITQKVFPSFLSDSEYANRKIIFYVTEKDYSNEDSLDLQEKIKDMDSTDDLLSVMDPTAAATAVSVSADDSIVAQITLPLPNQLSDSQDHTWENEMGLVGRAGKALMGQSLGGIASSIGGSGKIASAVSGAIGAMDFTMDTAVGYASHAAGTRKPIANPGFWQNYTGSTPRRFALSYEFLPESQEEATTIRDIILLFKMYASPSKSAMGSAVLMAPYYFRILISNTYVSQMFNMNSVVITSVQVDYGSDGSMQLFNDGFPKMITMSLQMQETSLALADNYANSYGASSTSTSSTSSIDLSNFESAYSSLTSSATSTISSLISTSDTSLSTSG